MKQKYIWIIVGVIVLVAIAGYFFVSSGALYSPAVMSGEDAGDSHLCTACAANCPNFYCGSNIGKCQEELIFSGGAGCLNLIDGACYITACYKDS